VQNSNGGQDEQRNQRSPGRMTNRYRNTTPSFEDRHPVLMGSLFVVCIASLGYLMMAL